MKDQKLLISATLEEVAQTIGKILEEYLSKHLLTQTQQASGDRILSRKETAELLKITLPTLHAWTQRGLLHPHKVENSSRVYYLEAEVKELIQSSKKSALYAY